MKTLSLLAMIAATVVACGSTPNEPALDEPDLQGGSRGSSNGGSSDEPESPRSRDAGSPPRDSAAPPPPQPDASGGPGYGVGSQVTELTPLARDTYYGEETISCGAGKIAIGIATNHGGLGSIDAVGLICAELRRDGTHGPAEPALMAGGPDRGVDDSVVCAQDQSISELMTRSRDRFGMFRIGCEKTVEKARGVQGNLDRLAKFVGHIDDPRFLPDEVSSVCPAGSVLSGLRVGGGRACNLFGGCFRTVGRITPQCVNLTQ